MSNKQKISLVGCLAAVVLLSTMSCREKPKSPGSRRADNTAVTRQQNATVLLDSAARTLNSLPDEVSLELTPPVVVLDDSRSADGKEILATLGINPKDPEGGYTYLSVPRRNANFVGARVQAGDVVRYFIKYDTEGVEHGGGVEVDYVEIPVRRLDSADPYNALILDIPLGPVEIPHRIEVWRFSDVRMNEIWQRLRIYLSRRDPAIGWEPTPDESALIQLVERVNQWYRNFKQQVTDWKMEPRLESLRKDLERRFSEQFAESSYNSRTTEADLLDGTFDLPESRSLQEAIWHRDISTWAKGYATEELEIAQQLFDWTIRNIQLDNATQPGIVHQPWQALMYGHGTAAMRAWVFTELCRQQFVDTAILQFGTGEEARTLVAVLAGKEAYLFDPELGLPLCLELSGTPLTWREVTENPDRLRELDLNAEQPYPLSAEQLQQVSARLVATPLQLSRRAQALEGALKGEDFVVLKSEVARLAPKVTEATGLEQVELWAYPYEERIAEETMLRPQRQMAVQQVLMLAQRPKLWKARVLHFMGPKPIPVSQQSDPLARPREGHREAMSLYQDPQLRLPDKLLDSFDPSKRQLYQSVKYSASYWLGLLSYDLENYRIAQDWFEKRTLDYLPGGFWAPGAKYNLARTLEKLDQVDAAGDLLQNSNSPQSYGDQLRARFLMQQGDETSVSGESTSAEDSEKTASGETDDPSATKENAVESDN